MQSLRWLDHVGNRQSAMWNAYAQSNQFGKDPCRAKGPAVVDLGHGSGPPCPIGFEKIATPRDPQQNASDRSGWRKTHRVQALEEGRRPQNDHFPGSEAETLL